MTQPLSYESANKLLNIKDKRDRLFFACMLYSGRRVGEIKSLKWSFLFDEKGPKVYVSKQDKYMYFPRSTKLLQIIEECYEGQEMDSFVFTGRRGCDGRKPITHKGLNDLIKKYFSELGVNTRKEASHCLRKTFARNFYEKNGATIESLQRLKLYFGHTSLDYTFMYTGLEEEEINDMVENVSYS